MRIDWDVPIAMDDGLVLRADVFRPVKDGRYPVILSYGPYAKGLAFQDGYPSAWQRMAEKHPDVTAGSSNLYQSWEVVDPEKWVPHDYACVRVDSRGCGCSPGFIDHFSPRETKDFYDCIEWAGVQPWSNGKVGLNGISYYGINQWHVATLQPPHLAAMCIWEGAADWYRDMTHHGGILCTFWENWYDMQVKTVQYGAGERGRRSRVHGELVCGPETLSEAAARRQPQRTSATTSAPIRSTTTITGRARRSGRRSRRRCSRPPTGAASRCIRAAISKASCARPPRTNGSKCTASSTGRISTPTTAASCSSRFFDHFLHGKNNGWDKQPRVLLQVRHIDKFVERAENEWPLERTKWTKLYLDPASGALTRKRAAGKGGDQIRGYGRRRHLPERAARAGNRDHRAFGAEAVRLVLHPRRRSVRRAARVHRRPARRWCSRAPSTRTRRSARAGCAPRTASSTRSSRRPTGPTTRHDQKQPLKHGEVVELDIEIWPTSIVVPAGYRIGLTIRGKDYVYGGPSGGKLSNFKNELTGCGPFLHDDPRDRPPDDLRRRHQPAFRRAAGSPICCCRSFRPRRRQRSSVGTVATVGVQTPIGIACSARKTGSYFSQTGRRQAHRMDRSCGHLARCQIDPS